MAQPKSLSAVVYALRFAIRTAPLPTRYQIFLTIAPSRFGGQTAPKFGTTIVSLRGLVLAKRSIIMA